MKVLMVGVDKKRIGGMWTVAETYLTDPVFREKVELTYIPTNTYGPAWKKLLFMLAAYLKIIRQLAGGVDLVHIHMAEKGSTYRKGLVVHLAHLFGCRIVLQLHAGPFPSWYDTQSALGQRLIRSFFDSADRVLALGEFWKEELSRLTEAEKIRVLYNGSFCPETNPYQPDGTKLLYLGVMKRAKGTFDLIHAMDLIRDRLPDQLVLCICGTPEEEGIPELICQLGLEDRIRLPGWISREERLALFQEAQLVIHPSYFEALSMTVIEAMCFGIPVITTNISTMPELVGADGPLFEPGDVEALASLILELVGDRAKRVELSRAVYERARARFSVRQNIEETLQIYEEVCGSERESRTKHRFRDLLGR